MAHEVAIKVDHVSKDFVLPHEKITSIKSAFTNLYRKKNKTRETQHALKDISFEIKKGEFFGIVGRNGSGKSTMLKILAGIYQPTKGSITTTGKLVPFIELGVGFNPELTGRENVYLNGAMLGFSRKEIEVMYDDIVRFAELERFMDQKLKNYSSGMQVRLAFSMATRSEAEILLIDEVLAVGDADFQRKCFDYFKTLKKNHKTVVFVSHDMSAVREYCDRAVMIEKSEIVVVGNAEKVARHYSKLFLENDSDNEKDEPDSDRWGTGDIRFTKVTVEHKDGNICVTATAKARKTVEGVLYGLHIVSQDGQEVTATNNRMINEKDIPVVTEGETKVFRWEVLNIFSDGKFSVTLTLANGGSTVFDWHYNAAKFTVRRDERSTTPVLPPIKVEITNS